MALLAIAGLDVELDIRRRQQALGLLGPFDELQALGREDIPKARVLPFLRIVEAIEVEVPDRERGAVSATS
jgi:hypothetical protein